MPEGATIPVLKIRTSMVSDVGVVREHNEDSALIDEDNGFFIVADGMGGHAAGEIASAMAVQGVKTALSDAREAIARADAPSEGGRQVIAKVLEEAVRQTHIAVYERGQSEADKRGMGTTLDVLLLSGSEAFVAHVGDSRTYLMRDGKASQITTDHTVAEVLVIKGELSAEEAAVSPMRTILMNALGVGPEVGVELAHLTLQKGDRILLCSDGLHDYFPQEEELFEQVDNNPPDTALATLVDLAKERGGHDNITGIIVEVLEAPEIPYDHERARRTTEAIPERIRRDDTEPVRVGSDARMEYGESESISPREPTDKTKTAFDGPTKPASGLQSSRQDEEEQA